MSSLIPLFILLLPLAATVFWLWMFWEMVNNTDITGSVRFYWLLGFVFLSLPAAVYYYFTVYREQR